MSQLVSIAASVQQFILPQLEHLKESIEVKIFLEEDFFITNEQCHFITTFNKLIRDSFQHKKGPLPAFDLSFIEVVLQKAERCLRYTANGRALSLTALSFMARPKEKNGVFVKEIKGRDEKTSLILEFSPASSTDDFSILKILFL